MNELNNNTDDSSYSENSLNKGLFILNFFNFYGYFDNENKGLYSSKLFRSDFKSMNNDTPNNINGQQPNKSNSK